MRDSACAARPCMLAEGRYYARLALGLANLQLASRRTDCGALVREQMAHREERFLQLARHVLVQPQHFYRKLFDLAGCTYADLESSVNRLGLRPTLHSLLEAGVHVSHDE